MQTRYYILIISLLLLPITSFSQNDSLQKEILNYNNSKSVIISKARSLLLDKFIADDFKKTKEIKDYLINEVANNDYAAFYPVEYWLILYWTKDYDELIENINQFDSLEIASFKKKIKPQNDMLFEKVRNKSRESRSFLIGSVNSSGLSNVNKDFLLMNLDYLLSGEDFQLITQESLNDLADDFLIKHPDSIFDDFTRKYIRYKYVPSKWGYAMEFFSGYGILTGNLPKTFKNNVPFGIAFDIYYKHIALYLRDYIGFSKTIRDIPYSTGIWEKGSQVRVFLPEASLGYIIADNKAIMLAPFAGIAGTDIGPTQFDVTKEPDLKEAALKYTMTCSFGLNLDLKLGHSKTPLVSTRIEQSFWIIRLRYAYCLTQFDKKYPGYNGNLHYLTIGIGGFGRTMKREY